MQEFKASLQKRRSLSLSRSTLTSQRGFRGHGNMTLEINNLCRFYMDTGLSKELEFSEAALPDEDPSFCPPPPGL